MLTERSQFYFYSEVTEFFPTNLITECDDDDPLIPISPKSLGKSPSNPFRSFYSWESGSSQESRRLSDESVGLHSKGATGVSNIFRSDTLKLDDTDDKNSISTHHREHAQSADKLKDIREETMVEKIVDNIETINPVRKVSKESNTSSSEEKNKKSLSGNHSGSSVKDFMSSVTNTLRRNKSSGYYEDKNRNK